MSQSYFVIVIIRIKDHRIVFYEWTTTKNEETISEINDRGLFRERRNNISMS